MQSLAVVKDLNILKHGFFSFTSRLIDLMMYQLCFQGMEETFRHRVDAPMESFWGTLKSELVHHQKFKTRLQAKEEITEYIEIFYNRQRKQERLGYLSPAEFKQRYYVDLFAA